MKPTLALRTFLLLSSSALLCITSSQAATVTWNDGTAVSTDGNWSTAGNWTLDAAPANDDDLIFDGTAFQTNANDIPLASVASLTLNNAGWNISLGSLTLNGGITANGSSALGGTLTLGAAQNWSNSTGLLTVSGTVANGGNLLTLGGAGNTTISSAISGIGGLTKSGTGTLTLSGGNTYTGQLTIENGTLSIATINNASANGTLGNSALAVILGSTGNTGTLLYTGSSASSTKAFTLATGGTGAFDVSSGATNLTLSGLISGSGALTKTGSGTLTFSNVSNSFSGGTLISGGRVNITSDANLGDSSGDVIFNGDAELNITASGFSMAAGRTITINGSSVATFTSNFDGKTFNGILEGSGTLFANTTTSFYFANTANTFTGTLRSATGGASSYGLDLASLPDESGNGNIQLESGTFRWFGTGGTKTFDDRQFILAGNNKNGTISNRSGDGSVLVIGKDLGFTGTGARTLTLAGTSTGTFSGNIGDNGASAVGVTKSEGNTWILSGTNGYTGATLISGGILQIGDGGTTGSLSPSSAITNNGTLAFNRSNAIAQGTDFAAGISGTGAVQQNGAGNLTLSGINTYSGSTTVNAGTLTLASNTGIQNSALVTTGAGSLSLGAGVTTPVIGGLSGATGDLATIFTSGYGGVTNLTLNPLSGTVTYGGAITDGATGMTLTKTGAGTQILSGTNTYTGGTTLNGGTLSISANNNLGAATTSITVNGNSTLTSAAAANVDYTRAISLGGNTLTLQNSTNATTAQFSGAITGSGGITVVAGGTTSTVALSNTANSFTGDLTLSTSGGTNLFASFSSIGDAGVISTGVSGWRRVIQYTGDSNLVLNTRRIDLGASFGGIYDGNGNPVNMFESNGAGTVTFNSNLTVANNRTGTFFLGGTNAGGNTFAGLIPNSTGGILSIAKAGAGKWILTRDNTFSGNAVTAGGILSVAKILDSGEAQPLGVGSIIQLGDRAGTGNLEFTGTTNTTTDKQIQLGGTQNNLTGGGGILNNGTGTLTFENPIFNTPHAIAIVTRTLTLGGSNAGDNTISGTIQNNNTGGGGLLALTKIDGGTWILGVANSYTGATTINGGTLKLGANNAVDSSSAVTVNSTTADTTATLDLNGYAMTMPSLTFGGTGATTTSANQVIGTGAGSILTLNGGVTYAATNNPLGATISATTLDLNGGTRTFNIGDSISTTAELSISSTIQNGGVTKSGTGTMVLSGGNTYSGLTSVSAGTLVGVGSNAFGSTSGINIGNNTSAVLSLLGDASTNFVKASDNTPYSLTTTTATGVTINVDQATLAGTSAKTMSIGTLLLNTSVTNGTTFTGSNNTSLSIGAVTTGNSASGTETLTNNIAGGGSLTLASIAVQRTTAPTLAFAGNGDTTVTGAITEVATTALTKSGNGTLTLAGANSYSGITTLSAGTLVLSGSNSAVSGATTVNVATLHLNSASNGGLAGGDLTLANSASMVQAINADRSINNQVILSANSTFSGDYSLGISNDLRVNGGNWTFTNNIVTGKSLTINTISRDGTNNRNLVVDGSGATSVTGGITLGSGTLTKNGAGTLTLGGTSGYSGNTSVTAGTLSLTGALTATSISTSGTAVFDQALTGSISGTSKTFTQGSSGTSILAGTNTYTGNTSVTAGTLSLTGSLADTSISTSGAGIFDQASTGSISGASKTFTQGSSGTSILAGANTYTGNTSVSAGTLSLTGSLADTSISTSGTGVFDQASAGSISGASKTFTQGSSGTSILAGTNTYTGNTSVTAGTLSLTGSLSGTNILTSSTGVFNQSSTGSIAGAGNTFTQGGSGISTLAGANSYSGLTTVSAGTLVLSGSNSAASGATTVNAAILQLKSASNGGLAGGDLTLNNNSAVVQAINADRSISNQVILNANATFSGDYSLEISNDLRVSGGNRTIINNFVSGKSLTINTISRDGTSNRNLVLDGSGATSVTGGITLGSGTLTKNGAGTLSLGGTSGYSGNTSVTAGVLSLSGSLTATSISTSGTGVFEQSSTGVISGAGKTFTQGSSGTSVLAGSNDFTGATSVSSGTLVLDYSGVGPAIGSTAVNINSGTLRYGSSAGADQIPNTASVTIGGGAGLSTLDLNGKSDKIGALALFNNSSTSTSQLLISTGAGTLTLNDANTAVTVSARADPNGHLGATISGKLDLNVATGVRLFNIADSTNADVELLISAEITSSGGGFRKGQSGTVRLTAANTYTGGTIIDAGVLETTNIQDGGFDSGLGKSSNVAGNLIFQNSNAVLRYIGTDIASTDRAFTMTANGAIIESSGVGTLSFTDNTVLNSYGTAKPLTLGGTNTGANTFGKIISSSTTLNKAGPGTWVLDQANTYTGATNVNGGALVIGGGSLANTAITVNNAGSMFAVNPGSGTINLGTSTAGTAGATLTLNSGTSFSMVDGAIGTVNLQQQASFASSGLTLGGDASLNFEVGSATADKLAVTKGATVTGTNLINVAGVTSMGGGPYDLITAPSGLSGTYVFGGSGTTSQTVAVGTNAYALTLGGSDTAVTLNVGSATSISGVTWTGQTNGNGAANSNWDNAISNNWAAISTASAVSNGTAVTFGDTNAANSDAAITNTTVTVATLGVSPTSTTFNNSDVNYTVGGGAIGGTGTLTKSGTGTVTLSGANSYTGATTVSAGTLVINGDQSLATGTVTVNDGGILGGSGTLGGGLVVNEGGVHNAGNSPGLQTINGQTTYNSGSIFEWDLAGNVSGTSLTQTWDHDNNIGTAEITARGSAYDAVNINGGLTINADAIFKVIMNTGVDFNNVFWTANQTWSNIFNQTGTLTSGWNNIAVSVYNTSNVPQDVSSYGSFTMTGATLSWQAIPEPTTALAGLLLAAGLLRRRRK